MGSKGPKKKALVVVLGELARSPRMQYHCVSLAKNNYHVTVIGHYGGAKCCDELETNENIDQWLMSSVPNIPKPFCYLFKPIWQSLILILNLILLLIQSKRPSIILVQNPPSIPVVQILCLYKTIIRSKLIIDWHNYGYSIMSLQMKPNHILVKLAEWMEFTFGRYADAGFCVSKAMRIDLQQSHGFDYPIEVLYDRPPKQFKHMTLRNKHDFFLELKDTIKEFRSPFANLEGEDSQGTRFTINDPKNENIIMYRPNRPAIIFSSTSWTEDEDFSILLKALKAYDNQRISQLNQGLETCLPYLVCVITGKGPLKVYYEAKIKKEYKFKYIDIILPWFSSKDYPRMVSSADMGISLHNSSCGFCLPMKVVDMFGCSVPVLAYRYKTIRELMIEDMYGKTFENDSELYQQLVELLQGFHKEDNGPGNNGDSFTSKLSVYRKNISRHFLKYRWDDNWETYAKPLLEAI